MKVGIIGIGQVGSATAYTLLMRGVSDEVVLIDINQKKAEAEALDISHATTFAYASKIYVGSYEDLKGAGIVIVTAGANQKPGETRIDLMDRNVNILKGIAENILKYAPKAFVIMASNPVDIMTNCMLELSGLPKNQVFGSGTILDTSRFRTLLGDYLGISSKSVHANVLGEHGDSEVLIWSNANAGTLSVEDFAFLVGKPLNEQAKKEIDENVRGAAYKIIEGKGATFYGIAGGLTRICQAIATNENAVMTVSSFHENVEGVKKVCLSMPTVVNEHGIERVFFPSFSAKEHELIGQSAQKLSNYLKKK